MTRRVVPLDDLERLYAEQADEIRSAVEKVLASGRYTFTKGKEVESFERAFADYIGTGDCVGVSSGTAALWLALDALGIGPGDEVIVPANTYVASVFVISYLGATPVLADVGEATFTLDPAAVETVITSRTAALLPVHLFGAPCDMDALSRIAASAGLAIVEDAAQAHGATLHGKRVGTFGAAGCFSFYPTKNLGAMGDGGALTTDDPAVAASVRRQRYMGQESKYTHLTIGYQERLDEIQAAVLATRLPRLDAWNAQRRHQAHLYNELLAGHPGGGSGRTGRFRVRLLRLHGADAPPGRACRVPLRPRRGNRPLLSEGDLRTAGIRRQVAGRGLPRHPAPATGDPLAACLPRLLRRRHCLRRRRRKAVLYRQLGG